MIIEIGKKRSKQLTGLTSICTEDDDDSSRIGLDEIEAYTWDGVDVEEEEEEVDEDEKDTRIRFGDVQVRSYERIIDTDKYMGLSLGWKYVDNKPKPILKRKRSSCHCDESHGSSGSNGTHGGEFKNIIRRLPNQRYMIFLQYGYNKRELKKATQAACRSLNKQTKIRRKEESIEKKEKRLLEQQENGIHRHHGLIRRALRKLWKEMFPEWNMVR